MEISSLTPACCGEECVRAVFDRFENERGLCLPVFMNDDLLFLLLFRLFFPVFSLAFFVGLALLFVF